MNYHSPMTPEEHAAHLSMPRTADGFVMNLFFVPPAQRAGLEGQWREWARGQPKHLHPNWFADWARYKQSGHVPSYVGGLR
jgi:hypothetical protein